MKNTRIFELLLPCRREKINTTSEFADGDKKGPERQVAKSGAEDTSPRAVATADEWEARFCLIFTARLVITSYLKIFRQHHRCRTFNKCVRRH